MALLPSGGNNFRDNPVYGTADMKKNKLTSLWSAKTSSITYNGATLVWQWLDRTAVNDEMA